MEGAPGSCAIRRERQLERGWWQKTIVFWVGEGGTALLSFVYLKTMQEVVKRGGGEKRRERGNK